MYNICGSIIQLTLWLFIVSVKIRGQFSVKKYVLDLGLSDTKVYDKRTNFSLL